MTDFPGEKMLPLGFAPNPHVEQGYDERQNFAGIDRGLQQQLVEHRPGTLDDVQPIDIRDVGISGRKLRSFADDFYRRVYLLPTVIEFGPVSATTTAVLTLWNANFESVTLDTVTIENPAGVSVSGQTLPLDMPALSLWRFDITAAADGPPVIAAEVLWDFSSGELHRLPVTGLRATLWELEPDWREGYKVSYEFKTEILTSYHGKEQRRALRQTPRKSIEQVTQARQAATLRRIERILATRQAHTIVLPELTRWVRTEAEMVAGTTTAVVAEIPGFVAAGYQVAVVRGQAVEIRQVASVNSGTGLITFATTTSRDWPAGTKIHPALSANFNPVTAGLHTNAVALFPWTFDVRPATEPVEAVPEAPHTFNGRELWIQRPNWREKPQIVFDWPRETVDYGRGRTEDFVPVPFGQRVWKAAYVGRTNEQAHQIVEFFRRMRGQQGEFYAPTWTADLLLRNTVTSGSTTLEIDGTEIYDEFRDDTMRRAVMIRMRDGRATYKKIISVTKATDSGGAYTRLGLSAGVPYTIDPADVLMVCWLMVWRFASDMLTVEWLTSEVAQVAMTWTALEDLEGT